MSEHYKFTNHPLPCDYNALEPYIDEKTMRLHHDKHLQTYTDNLNTILKEHPELQNLSLEQLLVNGSQFPESVQIPIKNNAGGVYNHQFYFSNLVKSEQKEPEGKLAETIASTFGSYEAFKKQLKEAALSVFGSGYAWLVFDENDSLKIVKTSNQDTTITQHLYPLLNLDVWEHAYYVKHYNVRADYIDDWFQVVNWRRVEERFAAYQQ